MVKGVKALHSNKRFFSRHSENRYYHFEFMALANYYSPGC
jgi:hypothetical protein